MYIQSNKIKMRREILFWIHIVYFSFKLNKCRNNTNFDYSKKLRKFQLFQLGFFGTRRGVQQRIIIHQDVCQYATLSSGDGETVLDCNIVELIN